MDTPSSSKFERMAKASRNSGIISLGLLAIFFLFVLWLSIVARGETEIVLIWLGALGIVIFIAGLMGCFRAIIVLVKIKRNGGDNKLKQIATAGLILNGLEVLLTSPSFYIILLGFS